MSHGELWECRGVAEFGWKGGGRGTESCCAPISGGGGNVMIPVDVNRELLAKTSEISRY